MISTMSYCKFIGLKLCKPHIMFYIIKSNYCQAHCFLFLHNRLLSLRKGINAIWALLESVLGLVDGEKQILKAATFFG